MDTIGAFQHWIHFQSYTGVAQPSGQILKQNWTTYASAWASIAPLSSREFFNAQQAMSEITHKISTWYITGVNPDHRILWGSRIFQISCPVLAPRDIGNNIMQLMAIERGI